jgi:signal transduction histidine kinase
MTTTIESKPRAITLSRLRLPGLPRHAFSTRVRILGWYVFLLALAIAFGLFIQRTVLLRQVNNDVNTQLAQEVRELEQLSAGNNPNTGQPFGNDVAAIFDTFLRRNIPIQNEALYTLIDGRPHLSTIAPVQLLNDPDVVAEWAAVESPTRSELSTEEGRARYLAVPIRVNDEIAGTFVVTIFLDEQRGEVNDVVRGGAIVFGLMLVGASVVAWFVAGRILRPVSLLTETARSITDSSWSDRIPVTGDDEIAELTQTFNDMLDRLEHAFATQRRFIDDAGHELRTPITIIRGHLELMSDDAEERRETIYLVTDELDRMARLVDDLLLLARSEQRDFLDLRAIDVAELTRELGSKASAMAERRWNVDQVAEVVMVADRQRLTQALMNLVRNAVEHTKEGEEILIGSRNVGDDVLLWVTDNGEGISPAEHERIFQRFARGRAGRRTSDGAGLGLAIVDAIAKAHGGRVALESQPGMGSTFTLVLPIWGPAKEDS